MAEVARAHGMNANQVFKWRRAFERGELREPCANGSAPLSTLITARPGNRTRKSLALEVTTLERYLNANPETRIAMLRHLSRDLSGKVAMLLTADLNDDESARLNTGSVLQVPSGPVYVHSDMTSGLLLGWSAAYSPQGI